MAHRSRRRYRREGAPGARRWRCASCCPTRWLFEVGSADLRPEAAATLDRIVEVVAFYAEAPVSIRGHTDTVGSEAFNQNLSARRADGGRIEAVGLGENRPAAPNTSPDGADNPAGREQNRHVEIVVEGVQQ
ncbi:MAG: OmpA family protein [Acidimicrobiales bacterium]